MKFGIIGYGSIGKRHIRNLLSLGYDNIVLLREHGKGNDHGFAELADIETLINKRPDAVIISNPTSLHYKFLTSLMKENINVLVEKPVVSNFEDYDKIKNQLPKYFGIGMAGFNMRFHPCVKHVHRIIANGILGKIYSSRFFVGQFLPDWRPNIDYSKSYSANKDLGGGVLFDLVHEIDLACYLIGMPEGKIMSHVNKLSNLKINSEDLAEILFATSIGSMVSLHLDYLSRHYHRYIEIIGENGNLYCDLFRNKVSIDYGIDKVDKKVYTKFSKNDMYLDMLSSFIESLKNKSASPIPIGDGLISNKIAIELRNKYYGKIREK